MREVSEFVRGFATADNIALISVIITILLFVFSRVSELKYKKHEDKKVQYLKLITLLEQLFISHKKDKKGDLKLTDDLKKQFFDVGASLLLYGSKKMYKQYLFFRELTSNPLIMQSKHYQESLSIYIMSDILTTMRKEVGLSTFNNIQANEALAFIVNDVTNNPIAKEKMYDAKFRIKMIKFELAMIDRTKFIYTKKGFYIFIKPIFAGLPIILKHLIVMPFGRLLIKLFPNFANKAQHHNTNNVNE